MGRLADKNILITGGNSGIGLAAAQEFDREGARGAICGLNAGSLQAAKKTLRAGSLAVRADVSNLTDLDTMFATIKREFGYLDGLFVNAGYSEFLPFEEVTEQSFDMVIGSNFKGAYFTIQKALPLLRPGSSVVINASVGARKGWPTTSTVSTCQAAVVHLAPANSSPDHCQPMSDMGQKRPKRFVRVESVLLPTADIARRRWQVSSVP